MADSPPGDADAEALPKLPRSTRQGFDPADSAEQDPARIHNYEIVGKIGEGGMGRVFRARHHFFAREAAVKILHARHCADERLVQRFLNEARAANAIRHANIIEVIDTGLLPDSLSPYMLMELLAGEDLGKRLQRVGRLPVQDALQIAGQTASALAAAHDQGIVHRDLKPENVFLVPRTDGGDTVKVLDFGIAKLRPDLTGTVKTQPGDVVGTPRYMSPEQCLATTVDHRTDIYALGVLLFEMLAGRSPFQPTAVGEMIAAHVLQPPPKLRPFNPEVSAELEAAVERALAKNPADRFASMRELRKALGPGAIPRPHQASTQMPSTPEDPGASDLGLSALGLRPVLTRRGLVPLVLGGVVLLGLVLWLLLRREPPASREAALPPAVKAPAVTAPAVVATPPVVAPPQPAAAPPDAGAHPAPRPAIKKRTTPKKDFEVPFW